MRLFHDSGDVEALQRLSSLFLRVGSDETEYGIEWLRMQKLMPVFKLLGIDDREAAEALVGAVVFTLLSESRPIEEGTWLVSELVGLDVFLAEGDGAVFGRIKSVIANPANDILEIETDKGARLLPFVDTFVPKVDTKGGGIFIIPPEGWF